MSNNGRRNTDEEEHSPLDGDSITKRLLEKLKYEKPHIDRNDRDLAEEQLKGLVGALESKKQVVLHGPPGVGKTQFMVWLADAVARNGAEGDAVAGDPSRVNVWTSLIARLPNLK
mgnify:CR=1 FL=1